MLTEPIFVIDDETRHEAPRPMSVADDDAAQAGRDGPAATSSVPDAVRYLHVGLLSGDSVDISYSTAGFDTKEWREPDGDDDLADLINEVRHDDLYAWHRIGGAHKAADTPVLPDLNAASGGSISVADLEKAVARALSKKAGRRVPTHLVQLMRGPPVSESAGESDGEPLEGGVPEDTTEQERAAVLSYGAPRPNAGLVPEGQLFAPTAMTVPPGAAVPRFGAMMLPPGAVPPLGAMVPPALVGVPGWQPHPPFPTEAPYASLHAPKHTTYLVMGKPVLEQRSRTELLPLISSDLPGFVVGLDEPPSTATFLNDPTAPRIDPVNGILKQVRLASHWEDDVHQGYMLAGVEKISSEATSLYQGTFSEGVLGDEEDSQDDSDNEVVDAVKAQRVRITADMLRQESFDIPLGSLLVVVKRGSAYIESQRETEVMPGACTAANSLLELVNAGSRQQLSRRRCWSRKQWAAAVFESDDEHINRTITAQDGKSLVAVMLDIMDALYGMYQQHPVSEEWKETVDRHMAECLMVIILVLRRPGFDAIRTKRENTLYEITCFFMDMMQRLEDEARERAGSLAHGFMLALELALRDPAADVTWSKGEHAVSPAYLAFDLGWSSSSAAGPEDLHFFPYYLQMGLPSPTAANDRLPLGELGRTSVFQASLLLGCRGGNQMRAALICQLREYICRQLKSNPHDRPLFWLFRDAYHALRGGEFAGYLNADRCGMCGANGILMQGRGAERRADHAAGGGTKQTADSFFQDLLLKADAERGSNSLLQLLLLLMDPERDTVNMRVWDPQQLAVKYELRPAGPAAGGGSSGTAGKPGTDASPVTTSDPLIDSAVEEMIACFTSTASSSLRNEVLCERWEANHRYGPLVHALLREEPVGDISFLPPHAVAEGCDGAQKPDLTFETQWPLVRARLLPVLVFTVFSLSDEGFGEPSGSGPSGGNNGDHQRGFGEPSRSGPSGGNNGDHQRGFGEPSGSGPSGGNNGDHRRSRSSTTNANGPNTILIDEFALCTNTKGDTLLHSCLHPRNVAFWHAVFGGLQQASSAESGITKKYGFNLNSLTAFTALFFGAFGSKPEIWDLGNGEDVTPRMLLRNIVRRAVERSAKS